MLYVKVGIVAVGLGIAAILCWFTDFDGITGAKLNHEVLQAATNSALNTTNMAIDTAQLISIVGDLTNISTVNITT